MEQQLASATNPGSTPRGANRCRHRSTANGRCRLAVQDPETVLCFTHAARLRKTTGTFDDTFDLSTDLFGPAAPSFQSAEEINNTLTNLVILVARGKGGQNYTGTYSRSAAIE